MEQVKAMEQAVVSGFEIYLWNRKKYRIFAENNQDKKNLML